MKSNDIWNSISFVMPFSSTSSCIPNLHSPPSAKYQQVKYRVLGHTQLSESDDRVY